MDYLLARNQVISICIRWRVRKPNSTPLPHDGGLMLRVECGAGRFINQEYASFRKSDYAITWVEQLSVHQVGLTRRFSRQSSPQIAALASDLWSIFIIIGEQRPPFWSWGGFLIFRNRARQSKIDSKTPPQRD